MTPIRAWDNIPVLSWLLLRAQCRNCKVAISALYPIVELLMGLLALLLFRLMVPDIQQITHYSLGIWCSTTAFVAMLVGLSFIDIRWKMIPDQFSIWAIPFGIGSAFVLQYLEGSAPFIGLQYLEGSAPFIGPTPKEAIIGAVAGIGSLLLIIGSYWLIRREEGMGMGDVKLLGMIGAFLGWQALAPVILMASVSGSIIGIGLMMAQGRGFRSQLPFGPFLSLGALAYLFFWPTIQGSLLVG
jgi:leader peptidase (prepilin peptidase)/N-methyltransferase